jgi:hypothetical protein
MGITLGHALRNKITMEAMIAIHAMMGFLFIGWWKITGKHLDD